MLIKILYYQIQSGNGDVTITNDGATILKEMQVLHPAAKMVRFKSPLFIKTIDSKLYSYLSVGRIIKSPRY